jgi:hypothetical protein
MLYLERLPEFIPSEEFLGDKVGCLVEMLKLELAELEVVLTADHLRFEIFNI